MDLGNTTHAYRIGKGLAAAAVQHAPGKARPGLEHPSTGARGVVLCPGLVASWPPSPPHLVCGGCLDQLPPPPLYSPTTQTIHCCCVHQPLPWRPPLLLHFFCTRRLSACRRLACPGEQTEICSARVDCCNFSANGTGLWIQRGNFPGLHSALQNAEDSVVRVPEFVSVVKERCTPLLFATNWVIPQDAHCTGEENFRKIVSLTGAFGKEHEYKG